jgi:hypothetical protein
LVIFLKFDFLEIFWLIWRRAALNKSGLEVIKLFFQVLSQISGFSLVSVHFVAVSDQLKYLKSEFEVREFLYNLGTWSPGSFPEKILKLDEQGNLFICKFK